MVQTSGLLGTSGPGTVVSFGYGGSGVGFGIGLGFGFGGLGVYLARPSGSTLERGWLSVYAYVLTELNNPIGSLSTYLPVLGS